MYVEDISPLPQSHSIIARRMQADMDEGMAHIHKSGTLLEMSVAALNAPKPVPYDDLYDVGFLGHGVLHSIAYVMAKDIVESDGPERRIMLLKQPSYNFVLSDTQLTTYGQAKIIPTGTEHYRRRQAHRRRLQRTIFLEACEAVDFIDARRQRSRQCQSLYRNKTKPWF